MELTGPIIPAREPPANLAYGANIHNASGDTSPLADRSSDTHTASRNVAPTIMPVEMPALRLQMESAFQTISGEQ